MPTTAGKLSNGQAFKPGTQEHRIKFNWQEVGKNGATGRNDIEGKVTRVGASEPGGERVSKKAEVKLRSKTRSRNPRLMNPVWIKKKD
jgi:hypothetical protein